MIRSMTGYGKTEHKYSHGNIVVEIKTVNHRCYELSSWMPSSFSFLEDKMRNHINTKVKRGKVNLNIIVEGANGFEKNLHVNKKLAKKYYNAFKKLQRELKIKGDVTMDQLVLLPDIITSRAADYDSERVWPHIKSALDKALDKLTKSRQREGAMLCRDLRKRIKKAETVTNLIKRQAPLVVKSYQQRLREKIKNISSSVKLDQGRLEQEVAIFAKASDITEEITRLKAHLRSFKNLLSSPKEVGRQLDFIAQELFRETNTINSKAQDIKISRNAIKIKEQIEKIREQVQNIE